MNSEVEKRLEVGRIGKPQLKRDELNKYLGNFRERVYLVMTLEEMRKPYYQKALVDRIENGFETLASLHLHAEIDSNLQSIYTKIAREHEMKFTLYSNNDNEHLDNSKIALVICSTEAVNIEKVDIAEMYPDAEKRFGEVNNLADTKPNLLQKLFGK